MERSSSRQSPDARLHAGRRAVLAGLGGVGLSALAGCTGDGDSAANEHDVESTAPESVVLDDSFAVEFEGLPDDAVDVRVSLSDYSGTEWTTQATYEPDDGTLDLDEAAPVDGAFDPGTMALVQRAEPTDDGIYAPPWDDGDEVVVDVVYDGEGIGSTTIDRTFGGVSWDRADGDDFVGWVAEPPGDDQAPGVLVLHGSEGTASRGMAQILAANGFVTLALQYFDERGTHDLLPAELLEVPLEFVTAGAEWLLDHDRVAGSQVGAWGVSKGGELALLAGSYVETIGAVVSLNGSGYAWAGQFTEDELNRGSSWTYEGEPVPYVPYTTDPSAWDFRSQPVELEPGYSASVADADADTLAAATIPVEEIDGPVLLVSGGDDHLWNSAAFHDVAASRLDAHDGAVDHLVYDDAGHRIWYPYLPATNRESGDGVAYGGTTAGHADADASHWPRVIETFDSLGTE